MSTQLCPGAHVMVGGGAYHINRLLTTCLICHYPSLHSFTLIGRHLPGSLPVPLFQTFQAFAPGMDTPRAYLQGTEFKQSKFVGVAD